MSYQYANGDLLNTPQHYQYSQYEGRALIDNWQQARQKCLNALPKSNLLPLMPQRFDKRSKLPVQDILREMCLAYRQQQPTEYCQYWLPVLIKKFEVTKRLFQSYYLEKPHKKASEHFNSLTPYLLLAEALIHQWLLTPKSYLISCLLKICDTLSTQQSKMDCAQQQQFAWVLEQESAILVRLIHANKGAAE